MTLTIKEALEHSGMENVTEVTTEFSKGPICWTCEYNGNYIWIKDCDGRVDWETRFTFDINGEKIATRCNYRTMIKKIKTHK